MTSDQTAAVALNIFRMCGACATIAARNVDALRAVVRVFPVILTLALTLACHCH